MIGALFAIGMIVNAVKPSDDKPSVDPWITGHMSQITQLNAAIQAFDGAVGRKDIVGGAQSAQQVADGFETLLADMPSDSGQWLPVHEAFTACHESYQSEADALRDLDVAAERAAELKRQACNAAWHAMANS